ncbi:MAG: hypothetical protein ACI8PZ_005009 [Myxococcota bacterium]|jgi:hypothetical protein
MGATFTAVHFRTDAVNAVAQAIAVHLAGAGLVSTDDAADRTVVLVLGDGWLSVYDEAAETDAVACAALVAAVGAALGTVGVVVAVADSDTIGLTLTDHGRSVDVFDSARRNPRRTTTHVSRWTSHFPDGDSALEAAFTADSAFAEAALSPLAQALGVPEARLRVGHRCLVEAPLPAGAVTWERSSGRWPTRCRGPRTGRRVFVGCTPGERRLQTGG